MSKPACLTALVVVLLVASSGRFIAADQSQTSDTLSPEPWDDGQIILIITKTAGGLEHSTGTFCLSDAKLVRLGDRWFVRGKPVGSNNQPSFAFVSHSGIAWDNVVEFSAFEREDFERFAEERRRQQEDDE